MLTDDYVKDNQETLSSAEHIKYLHTAAKVKDETLRQVGHDLHDSIGQLLTGIALMVKGIEKRITSRLPEEKDKMLQLGQTVDEAIGQISVLEKMLNPANIENRGIVVVLQELTANIERLFGIHCDFKCDSTSHPYNHVLSKQLYRITQEAVTNAIRHGRAKNITISLKYGPEKSVLTIKSDGFGFSENYRKAHVGMGLNIMKYRAKIIGGSICLQKGAKDGTVVACEFPNYKE